MESSGLWWFVDIAFRDPRYLFMVIGVQCVLSGIGWVFFETASFLHDRNHKVLPWVFTVPSVLMLFCAFPVSLVIYKYGTCNFNRGWDAYKKHLREEDEERYRMELLERERREESYYGVDDSDFSS